MKPLTRIVNSPYHYVAGQEINGANSNMTGDCSNLWGNCTGLEGSCSGLRGDCTGLEGDLGLITHEMRIADNNLTSYIKEK